MKKMSSPAVRTKTLLVGIRMTAGTNVSAPTNTPNAVEAATAATAASNTGQPKTS